ncbi:ATP-dependent RNA helicase [Ceratobasidium sp. 370]|nr:ATP-dependent RNA helicase [Ceratobasidium sp. 370]
MAAVILPGKFTARALKRKHQAIAALFSRKRTRTASDDSEPSGSDSEDGGLVWRPVARPAGAMLGAGLDEDGGLLTIEEIDDVEVEYVEAEGGGRVVKLKKRGRLSGKKHSANAPTRKELPKEPPTSLAAETKFDDSLLPEWASYSLHSSISHSLLSLSFTKPTPIQQAALPPAREGRDIVGVAETGSGKTLAYALPILHYVLSQLPGSKRRRELAALILAPTRELALQVCEHLKTVVGPKSSSYEGGIPRVSVAAIVGGLSLQKQRRVLERGADIIVATPGRLWDVLGEDDNLARQIRNVRFLVLDEADRMVEAGHFQELDNIVKLTARKQESETPDELEEDPVFAAASAGAVESLPANEKMQTFVFSATLSKELQVNLSRRSSRKGSSKKSSTLDDLLMKLDFRDPSPKIIDLSPAYGKVSTLKESRIECVSGDKDFYLYYFLLRFPGRSLVFVGSIDGIRRITPIMELLQLKAFPLHSQLQQRQRLKNLDRFKSTPSAVLIATDVAARGLDIPSVDHVIHYQLPRTADAYVHRNGRTARAQREGFSLLLVAPSERGIMKGLMESLKRTEAISEMPVEHDILDKLKRRVQLARQIDAAQHKVKKDNHEKNWLKETAEALDLELDSDMEAENERSHEAKKHSARVHQLKQELKALLAEPLVARGISRKYITSGSRPIADDLVSARNHKDMLGLPRVSAGDDLQ